MIRLDKKLNKDIPECGRLFVKVGEAKSAC